MEIDRPGPGEELNLGLETVARLAATVIVLRGGDEALEVLLVQRNPSARFMGGAWVFPGGAVDRGDWHGDWDRDEDWDRDGGGDGALRAAAVRELNEEAGIALSSYGELVPFSRWITPPQVKIRFDTWFYLAALPDGAEPQVDGGEVVDARWYRPADALDAYQQGDLLLVFPTIKHLEQLARFASTDELLSHARTREIVPVEPRVVLSGEQARVVLPGEPGYKE